MGEEYDIPNQGIMDQRMIMCVFEVLLEEIFGQGQKVMLMYVLRRTSSQKETPSIIKSTCYDASMTCSA